MSRPERFVGMESRDAYEISPPTHRSAPWHAAGRLEERRRGDAYPRASGREPDSSPLRLPAARVIGVVVR